MFASVRPSDIAFGWVVVNANHIISSHSHCIDEILKDWLSAAISLVVFYSGGGVVVHVCAFSFVSHCMCSPLRSVTI